MTEKKFNIESIYCNQSILKINKENEIFWITLKDKQLRSELSLENTSSKKINDNTYLVNLGVHINGIVTINDKDRIIYNNYVEYSAITTIEGYEGEDLDMILNINTSGYIFPYVRAELIRGIIESKMPNINIQPIDFVQVYKYNKSQEQKKSTK